METKLKRIHEDTQVIIRRLRLAPGSAASPLDDVFIDFLSSQTKESAEWDFKEILDIGRDSDFPKIVKDIFAFSNNGGGYLLIGWRDRPREPIGVPESFTIDQAALQDKFNSYSSSKLELGYTEFHRIVGNEKRKFAAIYIPASPAILVPTKPGHIPNKSGGQKPIFAPGDVFIRRGTQTIRAEAHEIREIELRVAQDNYQISLVSGEPDRINETLESNLFPVRQLPTHVFVSRLKTDPLPREVTFRTPVVSSGGYCYTFEHPLGLPLRDHVFASSISREPLDAWVSQDEGTLHLTWLLNDTIKAHARSRGMFTQDKHGRVYYPTNEAEQPRKARWRGMKRSAERRVAWKMYAQQVGRPIYVHEAAGVKFVKFGDEFYLQLNPTFVITEDGRRPLKDPATGSIVTKLSYNKYNAACYRDTHFWIEQFETSPGKLVLSGGAIEIACSPLMAETTLGIRGDYIQEPMDVQLDDDELDSALGSPADESEGAE